MPYSQRGGSAFLEPFVAATTRPRKATRTFPSHNRPVDSFPRHRLESTHGLRSEYRWRSRYYASPVLPSRRGKTRVCPTHDQSTRRGFATTQSIGLSNQAQPLRAPAEAGLQAGDDAYIPFDDAIATGLPTKERGSHKTGVNPDKGAEPSPVDFWPSQTSMGQSSWPSRPLEGRKVWKELGSSRGDGSGRFDPDVELSEGLKKLSLDPDQSLEGELTGAERFGELAAVSGSGSERMTATADVGGLDKMRDKGQLNATQSQGSTTGSEKGKYLDKRTKSMSAVSGADKKVFVAKTTAHARKHGSVRASSKVSRKSSRSRIRDNQTDMPGQTFPRDAKAARRVNYRNAEGPNEETRGQSRTTNKTRSTLPRADNFTARPSPTGPIHPSKPLDEQEEWRIRKAALQEKFNNSVWNPPKRLSPDAMEGVRALHDQYPDHFTVPVLAAQFKISPEAIYRILKNRWKPKNVEEEEERLRRWDRRGERIWTGLVEQGVHPPKKWRMMGIGAGPGRQAQDRRSQKGESDSSTHEDREVGKDVGSGWLNALSERL
ncbi:MAG: Required for respiratory growth protein 9 mitochondrial [Alyxoria varia]|nr:MAG: Required for respiratory growth protein 9 mitochondrial [Alyxoria varia]